MIELEVINFQIPNPCLDNKRKKLLEILRSEVLALSPFFFLFLSVIKIILLIKIGKAQIHKVYT